MSVPEIPVELATRIAGLALDGLHREYPNKIAHVLSCDADARTPSELTPMFFGCFDWHSAVHSHWCLIRILRSVPNIRAEEEIRIALSRSFTAENVTGELCYLSAPERTGFEWPYGLAWLLQLCSELREWDDTHAIDWSVLLEPLEQFAADQFRVWLPKLTHPIRSGEHSQTAFALGLVWDWCETAGDKSLGELLRERIMHYHAEDRIAALQFEPSGHDFLSPSLASADLMRRVLSPSEFANWLNGLLPQLAAVTSANWLVPAHIVDPSDGKLAHLHGLNLSRAWMLEGIAAALPAEDARMAVLKKTADAHREASLPAVTGEFYAISHWLGSFAVYLLTRRGIGE